MTEEYTVGRAYKRTKKGVDGWTVSAGISGIESEEDAQEIMLGLKMACQKAVGQQTIEEATPTS